MDDTTSPVGQASVPLAVLMTILLISAAVDIVLDRPTSFLTWHMAIELTMVLTALAASAYLWVGWYRAHRSLQRTSASLGEQRVERDRWRTRAQSLLRGLGEEIDGQLTEWGLTPAERETALMLLKGLSLKEIGRLTDRSERTVRQHAIAVYRKSGVSGRAGLSAFFLEDLLPPRTEAVVRG